MKKYFLAICISLYCITPVLAQDAVSEYFARYSEQEDYKTVYVTKRMFSLAAQVASGTDDQELEEAISNIQGLRSISSHASQRASFSEFKERIPRNYEVLMEVYENREQTVFWVKTNAVEQIKELVMLQEDEEEIVLVSIFGKIDLQQLARLAKNMDLNGLEKLERLENK